ncbi:hypothetical protein GLOIN_2v1484835 [Rhizophagus irregularis DAOM 181602=DAOM 197198]|nr:hypothetical protein GLOIN_2v1484835 [Rhizophagus irregularis DAOM 181602=DAOM 197198]
MLYLGLLPGPEEVKLHKINHFLSPIVNELLEFWDGVDLPSGKRIRMAVICCRNDIPAARKLCGHISALIVKKLWIDSRKITKKDLELMERRAKALKVPADIGRIPYKIATGEGFSGFMADQWKSFILIYETPLMWDLLDTSDREILANFVRACSLLVYNPKLMEALSLVQNRPTTGSLAAYDGNSENQPIVVSPNVSQFGHIQIATEIFGSALAPRYQRSSYITSKFIQDDESVDIFPRQVQFYFEHTVPLPTGAKTLTCFYKMVYVGTEEKKRFHCRIDNEDDKAVILNCGKIIFTNY